MNVSRAIAEHVAGLSFDALPAATVEMTKRSLLDAIGVSLGASGLAADVTKPFVDLALESGGRAEATILGVGAKAPMLMAALANGALAHALDFEDAHDGAAVHPNAQLIPALLAIAEAQRPVTGRDLITTQAAGCDLVVRLGLALQTDPATLGWYTPSVLGTMGAAAAAAKLMGANAEQVLAAMSLALGPAAASAEVKYSPLSSVRAVRDGFSAHAGLLAARLAMAGVKGFDRPIDGKAGFFALYGGGAFNEAALTENLGRRFEGEVVSFKPWPSCRGTHPFIEMALAMRAGGVRAADIIAMRMTGGPIQQMLIEPTEQRLRPATAIDAKFSLPFTTALAFVRGAVGLEDFSAASLTDPEVLALAAKTSFQAEAGRPPAAGRLEIELASGERRAAEVTQPLGDPSKPLDWAALETKFRRCAAYAAKPLGATETDRLIEAVRSLETALDAGAALFPGR